MAVLNSSDFQGIAQEATNIGINESIESIGEMIIPSVEEVKAAARELIQEAQSIYAKNGSIGDQLSALDTSSENSVLNFSRKMVKSREEFINLMQKVDEFQNIVNAFLGQEVQMTFVWIGSSGNVELYSIANSVENLTIDRTSKKRGGLFSGRYRSSVAKRTGELMQTANNYDKSSLDETFKEVWTRFNISKAKLKLRGAAFILWNIGGQWDGRWISGAGPLGEAYVNFFLNEYVFTGSTEPNVRDFMVNEKYGAELADNASGFLRGDVTKGNIEYGVKINNAQSLGYVDIIKYAQEVLESTDIRQYLLNLKQQLDEKSVQNMVRPMAEKMKEEYEPSLQNIQNEITKRINMNIPIT